jgi:hypothetical protein
VIIRKNPEKTEIRKNSEPEKSPEKLAKSRIFPENPQDLATLSESL